MKLYQKFIVLMLITVSTVVWASEKIDINKDNSVSVFQNEILILNANDKRHVLTTGGLNTCICLIIYGKKMTALAHITTNPVANTLIRVVEFMKDKNGKDLKATIIKSKCGAMITIKGIKKILESLDIPIKKEIEVSEDVAGGAIDANTGKIMYDEVPFGNSKTFNDITYDENLKEVADNFKLTKQVNSWKFPQLLWIELTENDTLEANTDDFDRYLSLIKLVNKFENKKNEIMETATLLSENIKDFDKKAEILKNENKEQDKKE